MQNFAGSRGNVRLLARFQRCGGKQLAGAAAKAVCDGWVRLMGGDPERNRKHDRAVRPDHAGLERENGAGDRLFI